ncbi:cupin [Actinorhabdospora filicis]|uniref:Cupin n=1 Tax=Actinorhabdospora filicis TaxID=1785913 RepID=A0A9W6SIJ5_9ACTN|nr:cupin domain-containing protein [Actinorhabdospora filicis]GLZ76923.1 cupin [Actinorhabdospora filicis]
MRLSPSDAKNHAIGTTSALSLAVPSRGTKELAVWITTLAPESVGVDHTVDREEIFIVQSGRVTAWLGGESFDLEPGDAFVITANTPTHIDNPTTEPAVLTAITTAGVKAQAGGKEVIPPWSV